MVVVKTKSYFELQKLSGKKVRFKSNCEFFPNFDVTGKIIGTEVGKSEFIFKVRTLKGKTITIGSNMSNLKYEIIKS